MFASDHIPNRLDLAKRKLRDILVLREEGQTALVVYAGDAHAVSPLTDDVVTITALVPSLSPNIMPLFGSNPVMGMELAIELLNDVSAQQGRILLMTDEIRGTVEAQSLADMINETNYQLLVMGIGTEAGAPIRTSDGGLLTDAAGQLVIPKLNRDLLQSLADRAGGRYHDIQLADSDLNYLLADYNFLDESLSETEEEFDVWYEPAPWLLLLILPLAALSFRRGWLFSLVIISSAGVLLPTQQAQAWEWKDLWQTRDQQAADALANDDPSTAAILFKSFPWSGVANYRAENYESAIAAFGTENTPDAHYNRGNALALAGNYAEAIAAYNVTLGVDSSHVDAIFNKEIVEKLLEQEEAEASENEGDPSDQEQNQSGEQEQEEQENSEQEDQQSQEGNSDEEQQEQQNQQAPEEQESSESNSEQNNASQESNEEFEDQQSLEQWLRRIDDDPGELLQRKFRYQYRQRQLNGTANNLRSGEQIW